MDIFIMRGLPRSGKSTKATSIIRTMVRQENKFPCLIDKDAIRKTLAKSGMYTWPFDEGNEPRVHAMALDMARYADTVGQSTIVWDDAIDGLTEQSLAALRKDVSEALESRVVWHEVELDTPTSVCIERAKDTGQLYLVPIIMSMEIERMCAAAEETGVDQTELRSVCREAVWALQRLSNKMQQEMRQCGVSETGDASAARPTE